MLFCDATGPGRCVPAVDDGDGVLSSSLRRSVSPRSLLVRRSSVPPPKTDPPDLVVPSDIDEWRVSSEGCDRVLV